MTDMSPEIGAIPSWSGYIFQGEVAICRVLETINALQEVKDDQFLGIEDGEDFAIHLEDEEVFQVKAYADTAFSKYKNVIEGLIDRHTYGVTVEKDEEDGRKKIYTRNESPKETPTKAFLISWKKVEVYTDEDFGDDHKTYVGNKSHFELVDGQYTLENIEEKIKKELKKFLDQKGLPSEDGRLDVIQKTVCQKICALVKEYHSNLENKRIPFTEIVDWIIACPETVDSDTLKHVLKRIFLSVLKSELVKLYNADSSSQEIPRLEKAEEELSKIDDNDFVDELLRSHVIPHRDLDDTLKIQSFGQVLDIEALKDIVFKALRKIEKEPDFVKLLYWKDEDGVVTSFQLTTINKELDEEDSLFTADLQEICEKLNDSSASPDTSFFITQHIDKSEAEVKQVLNEILEVKPDNGSPADELGSPLDTFNVFGLIKLKSAIERI